MPHSEEVGASERQKKAAIDRIEPKPARALAMATGKGVSSHPRRHCLSEPLPNPHEGMHTYRHNSVEKNGVTAEHLDFRDRHSVIF